MKMKKISVGLLVATMAIGSTVTAFAASNGTGNALDQLSATYKVYKTGEKMPEMPKGAVMINKNVTEANEENLNYDVKTYKAGEMPDTKPEGAVMLNKEVK